MLNIFSTPIYYKNISLLKKDINNLINYSYERIKIDNGFVSKDKYILNNKEFKKLKEHILKNIDTYLYDNLKIKRHIKFKMLNSWCMKHQTNDWADKHSHENSFISGILYLKTNINSGNLIFHRNEILNLFPNTIKIEYEEFNLINSDYISINPKDGDLVLFPSSIKHSVSKNTSKEDRYCCAFNLFPYGEFGDINSSNYIKL